MASYVEIIRQDVVRHESCDASWPSSITEFVQSLQNELKIPDWFKSPEPEGLVQYTNERVTLLLDQLRASDDVSGADLWDSSGRIMDRAVEQRLRMVFNTALIDCARIQAVVEAENLTHTPFPKESFLVTLVRNAVLEASERLYSLEDAPVVLPRHFSGEAIPILNYMKKSFYAPFVVSFCEDVPVGENGSGLGQQLSDEDNSSVDLGLSECSPPSLSEWLEACERPKTPDEPEEEQEEGLLSSEFEPHFLSFSPSATPPSSCHIPVLCMADEEQLPILLSSLLYQRRVWRISDPLVGLEFSKYDTTIKLFVGWLEDHLPSCRVLPRVHVREVRTPLGLDLSSPSVGLVVSRLLCGLKSHIRAVRDTARHSVGAVISDTQSDLSLSWRIDTDQKEGSGPVLENNSTRGKIIQWLKTQKCSAGGDDRMHTRKRGNKKSASGSATSSSTPQASTATPRSYPPPSSYTSHGESPSIPKPGEPASNTQSYISCSKFAGAVSDESRLYHWMFDRRVVPRAIPTDLEFFKEYSAMTGFIWPNTWNTRKDLPPVDAALEPYIHELLESVAALKVRSNAVQCIPVEDFPVDLRILEDSFSAIFQASRRSREKKELRKNLCEAAWRHDHDRLLFDFFIRLVQPMKHDVLQTLVDDYSVANLEDPASRPTLETTLRFPKSDSLQSSNQSKLQSSIIKLLNRQATDLEAWLESRGALPGTDIREFRNASYVNARWSSWVAAAEEETEAQRISSLLKAPPKGRCDAFGRLLVELPKVSPGAHDHFPLVVRSAEEEKEEKVAGPPKPSPRDRTPIRYAIASSSVSTSILSFENGQTGSPGSTNELTSKFQRLQLGADATYLELPILTAEYKKASDSLMKGTNQLRMYLTASVKFLQAIGITNFPVYGVQTDGPIVVLPAAVVRDDNFVYLFERLVERLDISTPVGAWHYATVLCRLAQNHAKILEKKFEEVKDHLVTALKNGDPIENWTMEYQVDKLKAAKESKS